MPATSGLRALSYFGKHRSDQTPTPLITDDYSPREACPMVSLLSTHVLPAGSLI